MEHSAIRSCTCLRKIAIEKFHKMQKAYDKGSVTCASVLFWHRTFSKGTESIVDGHQNRINFSLLKKSFGEQSCSYCSTKMMHNHL
jgi:hypothetical protein